MWVAAFIFVVPLGTGLALLLTSSLLNKSNNFGDSKCNLYEFTPHLIRGKVQQNRVRKNTPVDDIQHPIILEHIKEYDRTHGIG